MASIATTSSTMRAGRPPLVQQHAAQRRGTQAQPGLLDLAAGQQVLLQSVSRPHRSLAKALARARVSNCRRGADWRRSNEASRLAFRHMLRTPFRSRKVTAWPTLADAGHPLPQAVERRVDGGQHLRCDAARGPRTQSFGRYLA